MLRRHRRLSIRPRRCSGRSKFGGFLYLPFCVLVDGVSMRRTLCCVVWPRPEAACRTVADCEDEITSVLLAASFIIFGVLAWTPENYTQELRPKQVPCLSVTRTQHTRNNTRNCSGVARRIDFRAQPCPAPGAAEIDLSNRPFFGRLATALQRGRRCSVEGLPKVPSNMHDSEIGPRLSDYISIPRNS